MEDQWVMLIRLDASQGYSSMADLLPLVNYLQKRGIHTLVEAAPGAPLDGVNVHYLKVQPQLFELAQDYLKDYFSGDNQA